jgi:hypothetical protein
VLIGSVAAGVRGVPVEPRDFDVAPQLEERNLQRLATLLRVWNAKPRFVPEWPSMTREECAAWEPEPATVENLDHLFETDVGLFDVVPALGGSYNDLITRVDALELHAHTVLVAAPADLIGHLRLHTEKHRARLPYLEALLNAG